MLHADTEALRKCYGEYYISEIVLKSTTRDIIVAEVRCKLTIYQLYLKISTRFQYNNDPVGMLSFNTSVGLEHISYHYDLFAYRGFRRSASDNSLPEGSEELLSEMNQLVHELITTSSFLMLILFKFSVVHHQLTIILHPPCRTD